MSVRWGLRLIPIEPIERYRSHARAAETVGFDTIWVADSQLIGHDPYVYMTLAAQVLQRARVGLFVANPITRHPTVTACSIATVDQATGGRALLGIATGDTAVKLIGHSPARVEQLREAIVMIRELLAGRKVSFGGPEPVGLGCATRPIPVYVACSGPKVLRMAGEVADGVILSVGVDQEVLTRSIEAVYNGARAAGRPRGAVEIISQLYVIVADTRERARRWAKPVISYFYEMTPAILEWAGFRREQGRTPYLFPDPFHARNLDEAADAMAFLPDEMVDSFAIAGTADECVAQLRRLLGYGFPIRELAVQPALTYIDADKPELTHEYFIEAMGRTIIPGVSRA